MKEIPLANTDRVALVDDEDYDAVSAYSWCLMETSHGTYARRSGGRSSGSRTPEGVLMHRFILGAPKKTYVDHRNHDGLDNQRKNLRICTNRQNGGNARPKAGRFKGVFLDSRGRYRASIGIDGKTVAIGTFKREDHAAAAYNAKARESFGEFACVNTLINEEGLIREAMALIGNPKKRPGSSKFKGVCWSPSKRKWRATKNKSHIGYFGTEEDAKAAYETFD